MHIKTGDTVVVITGKDKGKKGKVIKAYPDKNKVVVEKVNMQTKHQRQTRTEAAEIKHIEGPIDASNVMIWDSKAKAPTRVGYETVNGQKKRVSKKSGHELD